MATTSPTPPGAAHELRLVPLFLLTEPPNARSPENVAGIIVFTVGHRRSSPPIRRPQGFPEHAGHPYGTAVSPRAFPPSPRSQSPPLASLATRAESSVSPAMAPPWPEPEQAAPARVVILLTSPGAVATTRSCPCALQPPPELTRASAAAASSSPASIVHPSRCCLLRWMRTSMGSLLVVAPHLTAAPSAA
nr:early nodulin-like protein 2 [Aegilops tauschii subsp. strangulata]